MLPSLAVCIGRFKNSSQPGKVIVDNSIRAIADSICGSTEGSLLFMSSDVIKFGAFGFLLFLGLELKTSRFCLSTLPIMKDNLV